MNGIAVPRFYLPSDEEFDPSRDDFYHKCLTKERNYNHFDFPLSEEQRSCSMDFHNEDIIHRFLPLLGFVDEVRKFSKNAFDEKILTIKQRPIKFASHADAAYLQSYGEFLSKYYEKALNIDGATSSVLAYRKGGATNIHHAQSLFSEIESRQNCSIFAIDISGFFDCIDHAHLKIEVGELIKSKRLTGHHWTVFNNITRYSWVETRVRTH